MVWMIIGIVLFIGILVGLGVKYDHDKPLVPFLPRLGIAAAVIMIFTFLGCIRSVPTGHTGVVVTFGRVEDYTLDAGIHFLEPWKSVKCMDNRTQIATIQLSCFSSDIQEVSVQYSVNYCISKADAQTIYRTIGENYLNTVMAPKVQEAVKGVFAKYNAESLIEQRGTLSQQIEAILVENVKPYNIEIVATAIENIDFTDAFTNAVEQKQVAEQNKLRAQTEQEQSIIEANAAAERQVIQAQADSDSAIIAAEADKKVQQINADAAEYAGQKEAAVLSNIGEQVTKYPGLINYYYYQSWDGKLPQTMLGSDNGLIIDANNTGN